MQGPMNYHGRDSLPLPSEIPSVASEVEGFNQGESLDGFGLSPGFGHFASSDPPLFEADGMPADVENEDPAGSEIDEESDTGLDTRVANTTAHRSNPTSSPTLQTAAVDRKKAPTKKRKGPSKITRSIPNLDNWTTTEPAPSRDHRTSSGATWTEPRFWLGRGALCGVAPRSPPEATMHRTLARAVYRSRILTDGQVSDVNGGLGGVRDASHTRLAVSTAFLSGRKQTAASEQLTVKYCDQLQPPPALALSCDRRLGSWRTFDNKSSQAVELLFPTSPQHLQRCVVTPHKVANHLQMTIQVSPFAKVNTSSLTDMAVNPVPVNPVPVTPVAPVTQWLNRDDNPEWYDDQHAKGTRILQRIGRDLNKFEAGELRQPPEVNSKLSVWLATKYEDLAHVWVNGMRQRHASAVIRSLQPQSTEPAPGPTAPLHNAPVLPVLNTVMLGEQVERSSVFVQPLQYCRTAPVRHSPTDRFETGVKDPLNVTNKHVRQKLVEPSKDYADEYRMVRDHELDFLQGMSIGSPEKQELLARQIAFYMEFSAAEKFMEKCIIDREGPFATLRKNDYAEGWHQCTSFHHRYDNDIREDEHVQHRLEQGSIYAILCVRNKEPSAFHDKDWLGFMGSGGVEDKKGYFAHTHKEALKVVTAEANGESNSDPAADMSQLPLGRLPDDIKSLIQRGRAGHFDACHLGNRSNNDKSKAANVTDSRQATSTLPATQASSAVAPAPRRLEISPELSLITGWN
ncbi:hypothetical protein OPT61_g4004 [Boeremia exigua]|uniref:Uncharacterized protein n=1 Tax=Boeremia exigua TaxID=749465 RepID=A0ACC2IFS9_9PLEO|nr:hypothetical protein OPT61_g4004 [Boeremia exigua]